MNTEIATAENGSSPKNRVSRGFTLPEVVIAMAICALMFGGMITAYVNATRNAEWSGFSLAAQALAIQQLEQARSAIWDPTITTNGIAKNEITNMMGRLNSFTVSGNVCSGYSWTNLDLPVSGGNYTRATNYVKTTMLNPSAGVYLQMVEVSTVWPFPVGNGYRLYTNKICTYIAPDNRDVSSL